MPERSTSDPKSIRENIARAKGYLRRNEFAKSLSSAMLAFTQKAATRLQGKDKFEIELLLNEYCQDLSGHPRVVEFLAGIMIRVKPYVRYAPGDEHLVCERLNILKTRLEHSAAAMVQREEARCRTELTEWLGQGRTCFEDRDFPRGRAALRRAADTYGQSAGVLTSVGEEMLRADFLEEAQGFLERAVEAFPNDDKAYSLLATTYRKLKLFEKAEALYFLALKQFGAHPVTLLNLSKMYLEWRKNERAFAYAKLVLEMDPTLDEAREIVRKMA